VDDTTSVVVFASIKPLGFDFLLEVKLVLLLEINLAVAVDVELLENLVDLALLRYRSTRSNHAKGNWPDGQTATTQERKSHARTKKGT